jgi:hypothetical protein
MLERKHICGYPIWVENEQATEQWVTRFRDAPDGRQTTRCPGCGGRLVPWEIKEPKTLSPEDEEVLGSALANLVERVEATLYARYPKQTSRWADLTREARDVLSDGNFEVAPPPWSSTSD